jgi:hypothetical protein
MPVFDMSFYDFKQRFFFDQWYNDEKIRNKNLFKSIKNYTFGESTIPNKIYIEIDFNGTKKLDLYQSLVRNLDEKNIPYEYTQINPKHIKLTFFLDN